MAWVCGVDVGSFQTLSYVAWLKDRNFLLDVYIPSMTQPLPVPPPGCEQPAYIGFDAPQGLPAHGQTCRDADRQANTPTRRLPVDRAALKEWRLYAGLVAAGVDMFWAIHSGELASIYGLDPIPHATMTAFETYPRFVIKGLWPGIALPSKSKQPLAYIDLIWGYLQAMGYRCEGVMRPGVDHVDAMLCAIAAQALLRRVPNTVCLAGIVPIADTDGRVVREGFIVGCKQALSL